MCIAISNSLVNLDFRLTSVLLRLVSCHIETRCSSYRAMVTDGTVACFGDEYSDLKMTIAIVLTSHLCVAVLSSKQKSKGSIEKSDGNDRRNKPIPAVMCMNHVFE